MDFKTKKHGQGFLIDAPPGNSRLIQISPGEFEQWFSRSKIRHPDGSPVAMFHGSDQVIERFRSDRTIDKDAGWYGQGIYFTADPSTASSYSDFERLKSGVREGHPNVVKVFLDVRRPYIWPEGNPVATTPEEAQAFRRDVEALGYDGIVVPNLYAAPEYANFYEVVVFKEEQILFATSRQVAG